MNVVLKSVKWIKGNCIGLCLSRLSLLRVVVGCCA